MNNKLSNSEWLKKFLTDAERGCESGPNGNPLYSYLCNKTEFKQLQDLLKKSEKIMPVTNIPMGYSVKTEELFVLYCAEWWRRCYKGGPWKWAPIIESLEWKSNDWKQRTEFVRKGLKYWKRDLLELDSGVQYLTSVATEGGIPINVLEKHGAIFKRYLKSVLKTYARYTGLGLSAEGIAQESLGDLPKSWRREQIATLTGLIVEQIWNLRQKITNPLAPADSLNENYPGWEKTLPLSLDSEQSKTLINSLLMSVQDVQSSKINRIKLERSLEKGLDGWVLKAEILLPKQLDDALFSSIGMTVSVNSLPERMDMYHIVGEERFLIARLTKGSDKSWTVRPIANAKLKFTNNVSNRHDIVLVERGKVIDSIPVIGGEELNDLLPQCFITEDEELEQFKWISQGSCKRKESSIYVLTEIAPDLSELTSSVIKIDKVFNKNFLEVKKQTFLKSIENEVFLIEPGLVQIAERDYQLIGPRENYPKTKFPLYKAVPVVQQIDGESIHKISKQDLYWRTVGHKQWNSVQNSMPKGDVEIRHMERSVSLASWKISILPKNSSIIVKPENRLEGSVLLSGIGSSRAYCEKNKGLKIDYSADSHTGDIELDVARDNINISSLSISIEWDDDCRIKLKVPFPAQGGTFVSSKDNEVFGQDKIVLSRLYSYHAQVVDPLGNEKFTLKGSLCSKSITHTEAKIHGFKYPLPVDDAGFYSLPLQQLKPEIEQLFAISTAVDDVVELELCGKQSSSKKIVVHQFEGELSYEQEIEIIHLQLNGDWMDDYSGSNLKLIPINDLELETIIIPWNDIRNGWTLPDRQYFDISKTYFASLDNENCYLIRPCIIPPQINSNETFNSELTQALLFSKRQERVDAINAYIGSRLEQDKPDLSEIISYLKKFSTIHPDGLDLVECLLNYPKAMSILWFNSTSDKSLNDYLNLICETSPFSWWMISIKDWVASVENWLNTTIKNINNEIVEDIFITNAKSAIHNLINEHAEINVSMELVLEKLDEHYTEEGAIFYARHQSDKQFWEQIINIGKFTPHPDGIDNAWPKITAISKMIELIPEHILEKINWPNDDFNFKQPILSAPIFAAIFQNYNIKLDEQLRVSLMAARNFDRFTFSMVFRGTQANLWVYSNGDKK